MKIRSELMSIEISDNLENYIFDTFDDNAYEFEKAGQAIINLNQKRCNAKGIKCGTDRRIAKMCSETGSIACYQLDENAIAGTIFAILDDQLYLYVIAHDDD